MLEEAAGAKVLRHGARTEAQPASSPSPADLVVANALARAEAERAEDAARTRRADERVAVRRARERGVISLTRKVLRERSPYGAPELNEELYLQCMGLGPALEPPGALAPFTALRVLWLEGNALRSLTGRNSSLRMRRRSGRKVLLLAGSE